LEQKKITRSDFETLRNAKAKRSEKEKERRACTDRNVTYMRERKREREKEREKPDEINEDGVEKKGGERKSLGLNRDGGHYSTSRVNLCELMTCKVLIDAL